MSPTTIRRLLILLFFLITVSPGYTQETPKPKATPIYDNFVQGEWSVEYIVRDPQDLIIPSFVSSRSYKQEFKKLHRGYQVTVDVHLNPVNLQNIHRFNPDQIPEVFRNEQLIEGLMDANYTHQALRQTLGWLERTAPYKADPSQAQDWESVMKRGSGNCVGRTELLKEICGHVNINVNIVSGVLWSETESIFHRWIETVYSGAGSFPSDPGATQDYVDPYHIVLAVKKGDRPSVSKLSDLGVTIQKVRETKNFWTTDLRPLSPRLRPALMRRQMRPTRYYGSVTGKIHTAVKGRIEVILTMNGRQLITKPDTFGNFSFNGLGTGDYELAVRPDWTDAAFDRGTLSSGELKHHTYHFKGR